ncbi:MAG: Stf0 family sulfotransferase [Dongiaceae bacterium]
MGAAPRATEKLTATELRRNRVSDQLDKTGHPVRLSYLILAEMRSGSTLLSDMLFKRGAGVPLEYFNENYRRDFTARLFPARVMPAAEGYLEKIRELRTTENGYFGVKCLLPQLRQFGRDLPPQRFVERFDRIVLLTRRNKLAQAISAMRAQQSGQWASTLAPESDRELVLDPVFVSASLRGFLARERSIRTLLKRIDRPMLFLEYESIETSLEAVWRDLQIFLDLKPTAVNDAATDLTRQADVQSLEFAQQYLRHIQGLDTVASRKRSGRKSR